MKEYQLTYQIRGAIYDTYNALGPGLLESVYEETLGAIRAASICWEVTQQGSVACRPNSP